VRKARVIIIVIEVGVAKMTAAEKIRATLQATKEKRKTQVPKVYQLKLQNLKFAGDYSEEKGVKKRMSYLSCVNVSSARIGAGTSNIEDMHELATVR
jgi:hypothetical protein